jgi:hypothetical protein
MGAVHLSVTQPERLSALVLVNTFAHRKVHRDMLTDRPGLVLSSTRMETSGERHRGHATELSAERQRI